MGVCFSQRKELVHYKYETYEYFVLTLRDALTMSNRNRHLLLRLHDMIPHSVNYSYTVQQDKVSLEHGSIFYRSQTCIKRHLLLAGLTYRQKIRVTLEQYRLISQICPSLRPERIIAYDYWD